MLKIKKAEYTAKEHSQRFSGRVDKGIEGVRALRAMIEYSTQRLGGALPQGGDPTYFPVRGVADGDGDDGGARMPQSMDVRVSDELEML